MGKIPPRGLEKAVSMSQPKPRGGDAFGGIARESEDCRVGVGGGGLLGLGHELQSGLLEGEGAGVAEELVEQRLGVEGHVLRGGEDAGVASDSAHAAGGGVVDGSAEELIEAGVFGGVELSVVGGGGDSGGEAHGCQESSCCRR